MEHLTIQNNESVGIAKIPVYNYADFCVRALELTKIPDCHCVNYYSEPKSLLHAPICRTGSRLMDC